MHDGGVSISIKRNGQHVCTSRAIYDGPKWKTADGKEWTSISKMTECEKPFTVKKGDKIAFEINYDEIAHPALVFAVIVAEKYR
jgi:hypothetical protein